MRRITLFVFLLLLMVSTVHAADRYAIKAAGVFDGVSDEALMNGIVVVEPEHHPAALDASAFETAIR